MRPPYNQRVMAPVERLRWRLGIALVSLCAVLAAPACRTPDAGSAAASAQVGAPESTATIQHEEPRRDFVGSQPSRFQWSAIAGADRYAIGLWNEVDRLVWRRDDITQPTIEWPAGAELEPGTYFWSVSALQRGREIARSGLAAFVVEQ